MATATENYQAIARQLTELATVSEHPEPLVRLELYKRALAPLSLDQQRTLIVILTEGALRGSAAARAFASALAVQW
ncbi:hypothetical protein [Microbacterium sp. TNHR37B]|uniref:hypothetical protein n=1 Tax=Microbacterium sp. TNHR37B TaxID=1775956 RepID=UPI0007B31B1B|nr:hypothetical protein [Microbacterium sp. TNHR37B]KZE91192.1 hypothetical protein AVP41_00727 [Microbacterium sp. TNHR37B]